MSSDERIETERRHEEKNHGPCSMSSAPCSLRRIRRRAAGRKSSEARLPLWRLFSHGNQPQCILARTARGWLRRREKYPIRVRARRTKIDQKWPPSYLLVYADARIVTGVRGRRRSANADRRSDARAADSWIAPARHRGDFAPGKARHALADALHDLRVTAPTCLQTRRRQGADPRLGQQPAVVRRFILGSFDERQAARP